MKLEDHVEKIRIKVEEAVKNTLDRCGITINGNNHAQQNVNGISIGNVEQLVQSIQSEKSEWPECFDEIVDDYAFTLFNRLVCMKVLEAHGLYPEMITQRQQHSGKSYAHYMWLENNHQYRDDAFEGLGEFINYQFEQLSLECDLFNTTIPLHMIPTATFIKEIIDLINAIDEDDQIEEEVWRQGNILSQIYEIYNNSKKAALKASGDKVEYDKVHVQSQIYTPEWVVKFLVDNSLGKLYLEMYPDSEIKDTHKIIGDFSENTREIKPLDEVKVIDPCVGSGNFLLYCFDLFYDLYMDQIENYGADYNSREVPQIIIEKNLHGIDLDERAVQLTKVGLFIKAKTKRNSVKINHYNVVSASFRLPDYKEIGNLFDVQFFSKDFSDLLQDVWKDLQQAHKFGSLLRIDEKFEDKKKELKAELGEDQLSLFTYEKAVEFDLFEQGFYVKLKTAVEQYVVDERTRFYADETSDAVRFLEVMAQKYDVLMSNPPYTDYNDFGDALRGFINNEYKKPLNLTTNLYSAFVKRDLELLNSEGYLALIHPDTFMYISTFEDLRQYSLRNMTYQIFVDYGLDRINLFGKNILVNAVWYVAKKAIADTNSTLFLDIADKQQEKFKKGSFELAIDNIFNKETNKRVYGVNQKDFLRVSGLPYMYYVSEQLRSKFYLNSIDDSFKVCVGLQTGSNEQFVRMWWEIQEKYNTPYNAKWYTYAKGGPYCKWYGNNWAVVNWENDGEEIKHNFDEKGKLRARPQNSNYYLKNGITYTAGGGKKTTFRQLKNESMFDVGGSCIFPIADGYKNIEYLLAFMNSRFAVFLINCLNPTVNTQVGDLKRIPFVIPSVDVEQRVSILAQECIQHKKNIDSNYLFNGSEKSPLVIESSVKEAMKKCISDELHEWICILENEALIDDEICSLYELDADDLIRLEEKTKKCVSNFPIYEKAYRFYIDKYNLKREHDIVKYSETEIKEIKNNIYNILFQKNNEVEDFCINYEINPITILYFVSEDGILPKVKTNQLAEEWMFFAIRDLLSASNDGILEISNNQKYFMDLLIEYADGIGISNAQLFQLEEYLDKKLSQFCKEDLFCRLMDSTNMYMFFPKTPFVWHLSSGINGGFEALISIYKWNADSLYKIKSEYIYKRKENLEYRKTQIAGNDTAQALEEKELIDRQLAEIDDFVGKIDELIASGYNPTLDDGVGKNIAPLQERKMLKADVLNANQLKNYLKAEW